MDRNVIMAGYGGCNLNLDELRVVVHQPQSNDPIDRARIFQNELDRQLSEYQKQVVEMQKSNAKNTQ